VRHGRRSGRVRDDGGGVSLGWRDHVPDCAARLAGAAAGVDGGWPFEECAAAAVRGTRGGARAVPGGAWCGGSPVQRVVDPRSGRVSKMATHTRGVIDTFEILNEPDGRWAFTGTGADYATLLRAGHDAIAAGNPRAKVAIAATMSLRSRPWLAQVLGAAGPHPERLYDIANLHIRASLRALPTIMRACERSSPPTKPPTNRCGSPSSATRPTAPTSTTAYTDPAPPPRPPISPARSPPCSTGALRRSSSPCATTSPVSSPPKASSPARSRTPRKPPHSSCANPPSPHSGASRIPGHGDRHPAALRLGCRVNQSRAWRA
jgi:hypothetical protein